MFTRNTVFILGAGASWHYSYPTGEQLVSRVRNKSAEIAEFFELCGRSGTDFNQHLPDIITLDLKHLPDFSDPHEVRYLWQEAAKNFRDLSNRLKIQNPLVIDSFLAENPTLGTAGKLVIALEFIQCETIYHETRRNYNHNGDSERDDWYRFIFGKMVNGCKSPEDIGKNKIHFVTFNYDVSIESEIYSRLETVDVLKCKNIMSYLPNEKFIHVYGRIREPLSGCGDQDTLSIIQSPFRKDRNYTSATSTFPRWKIMLDGALKASKGIRTINPDEKNQDQAEILSAKAAIANADLIYILGYGFDENNSDIIDLKSIARNSQSSPRTVRFTNFENLPRVDSAASIALFGNEQSIGASITQGSVGNVNWQKSKYDVYRAFQNDFNL